jgi:hypothetical protein
MYLCVLSGTSAYEIRRIKFKSTGVVDTTLTMYTSSAFPSKISFVGASLRADNLLLMAVDETNQMIYTYPNANSSITTATTISTSYASAAFRDLEFIGKPSKTFFTSIQNTALPAAEMFVQCVQCKDNSLTTAGVPAMSKSDCKCQPGYYTPGAMGDGFKKCLCGAGQFQSGSQ